MSHPRPCPAVLAALFVALVPTAGCVNNPSTGRSQFILPGIAAQAAAIGEQSKPQMIEQFGGEVASAELRAYVDRVGHALSGHVEGEFTNVPWEFITLDSDEVNAFALPGGKVFITRGLLARFENEAELAAVLGHEIGHVTGRHVDERISESMIAQVGLSVLNRYSDVQLINEGASLAGQMALLGFGRGQESEADLQGLKYMTAAGYDPEGMAQVMEVLLEVSRSGNQQLEILSTHPHPGTRLKAIRRQLAGPYHDAAGNPAYRLDRDRFQREALPYLGGGG